MLFKSPEEVINFLTPAGGGMRGVNVDRCGLGETDICVSVCACACGCVCVCACVKHGLLVCSEELRVCKWSGYDTAAGPAAVLYV